MSDTLRERLAKLAHEQWSGWMYYLFSKSQANDDGTVTIPKWAVERWKRQVETPYDSLPEDEKESDRKEADKFIAELERELSEASAEIERLKGEVIRVAAPVEYVQSTYSTTSQPKTSVDDLSGRKGD